MIIYVDVREFGTLPTESARHGSSVTRPTASHLLEAAVGAPEFVVLESCHSTWLFDPVEHRFCRVLKGPRVVSSVATQWRPYDHLVLHPDSDAFVVFLDSSGTRLLRSWRHTAHCDQCGGEVTAELSLEDLRRVARA
ncbi:MAG: hypothetical protein JWO62_3389 [Acidimicrobiaceae bacterium]|jgi:hypothetical protein|nr:hypothetical protein [Acidimicrobiaceae bacterium]